MTAYNFAEGTTYGRGDDYGQPKDWQMVMEPDSIWEDNSSESVSVSKSLFGLNIGVKQTIDNKHWLLDTTGQTSAFVFLGNASPNTVPRASVFLADSATSTPVNAQLIPANQAFSTQVTSQKANAISGEIDSLEQAA